MATELCPRCRALLDVRVRVSSRESQDAQGVTILVETRTYHCGACNAFIRSEDVPRPRSIKNR